MIVWLLLGVVLAGLNIGIAQSFRRDTQVRVFAVFLFLAAVIYLVFGAFHDVQWVALEGAGVVLFSLLAWVGMRRPIVLAVGWLLHAAWDGGLHLALEQPVVGPWLPLLCLPYDGILAGYLAFIALRRSPEVNQ